MPITRSVHFHSAGGASDGRSEAPLLTPARLVLLAAAQFFVSLWFSYAASHGLVTLDKMVLLGCIPIIIAWTIVTAWELVRH